MLYCRQSRTELRTQTTCMYRKFRNIRRMVFEICDQADKQTDIQTSRHADHNTSHPYTGEVNIFVRESLAYKFLIILHSLSFKDKY